MSKKNTHVVTVTTEYSDGLAVTELFRGSEDDCRTMATKLRGCVYDEHGTVIAVGVFIGPAKRWDDFLAD